MNDRDYRARRSAIETTWKGYPGMTEALIEELDAQRVADNAPAPAAPTQKAPARAELDRLTETFAAAGQPYAKARASAEAFINERDFANLQADPDYNDSIAAGARGISLDEYRAEQAAIAAQRTENERQNFLQGNAAYAAVQHAKEVDLKRATAERQAQVDRAIRNGATPEQAERFVPALDTFLDPSIQSKTSAVESFDGLTDEDALAWLTTPNANPLDGVE